MHIILNARVLDIFARLKFIGQFNQMHIPNIDNIPIFHRISALKQEKIPMSNPIQVPTRDDSLQKRTKTLAHNYDSEERKSYGVQKLNNSQHYDGDFERQANTIYYKQMRQLGLLLGQQDIQFVELKRRIQLLVSQSKRKEEERRQVKQQVSNNMGVQNSQIIIQKNHYIMQLAQELERVTESVRKSQIRVVEYEQKVNKYEQRIKELQEEVDRLKREIRSYCLELQMEKQEKIKWQESRQQHDRQVNGLQVEIRQIKQVKERQCRQMIFKIQQIMNAVDQQKITTQQLHKENNELQRQIWFYKGQLQLFQQKSNSQRQEYDHNAIINKQNEMQLERTKETIRQLNQKLYNEKTQKMVEIQKYKKIQRQFRELQVRVVELQRQVIQVREQKNIKQEELLVLSKSYQQLNYQYSTKMTLGYQTSTTYNHNHSQIHYKQTNNHHHNNNKHDHDHDHGDNHNNSQANNLSDQLNEVVAHNINTYKEEIQRLKELQYSLTHKLTEKSMQTQQQLQESQYHKLKLSKAQQQNTSLNNKIYVIDQEKESIKNKLYSLQEENNKYLSTIKYNQQEIQNSKSQIKSLRTNIHELNTKINNLQQDKQHMERNINELTSELSGLSGFFNQSQEKVDKVMKKYQEQSIFSFMDVKHDLNSIKEIIDSYQQEQRNSMEHNHNSNNININNMNRSSIQSLHKNIESAKSTKSVQINHNSISSSENGRRKSSVQRYSRKFQHLLHNEKREQDNLNNSNSNNNNYNNSSKYITLNQAIESYSNLGQQQSRSNSQSIMQKSKASKLRMSNNSSSSKMDMDNYNFSKHQVNKVQYNNSNMHSNSNVMNSQLQEVNINIVINTNNNTNKYVEDNSQIQQQSQQSDNIIVNEFQENINEDNINEDNNDGDDMSRKGTENACQVLKYKSKLSQQLNHEEQYSKEQDIINDNSSKYFRIIQGQSRQTMQHLSQRNTYNTHIHIHQQQQQQSRGQVSLKVMAEGGSAKVLKQQEHQQQQEIHKSQKKDKQYSQNQIYIQQSSQRSRQQQQKEEDEHDEDMQNSSQHNKEIIPKQQPQQQQSSIHQQQQQNSQTIIFSLHKFSSQKENKQKEAQYNNNNSSSISRSISKQESPQKSQQHKNESRNESMSVEVQKARISPFQAMEEDQSQAQIERKKHHQQQKQIYPQIINIPQNKQLIVSQEYHSFYNDNIAQVHKHQISMNSLPSIQSSQYSIYKNDKKLQQMQSSVMQEQKERQVIVQQDKRGLFIKIPPTNIRRITKGNAPTLINYRSLSPQTIQHLSKKTSPIRIIQTGTQKKQIITTNQHIVNTNIKTNISLNTNPNAYRDRKPSMKFQQTKSPIHSKTKFTSTVQKNIYNNSHHQNYNQNHNLTIKQEYFPKVKTQYKMEISEKPKISYRKVSGISKSNQSGISLYQKDQCCNCQLK